MKVFFIPFLALFVIGGVVEISKHVSLDFSNRTPRFIKITHSPSPLSFENIAVYDSTLNQKGWDEFVTSCVSRGAHTSTVSTTVFYKEATKAGPAKTIHILIGKRDSPSRQRYDYCFYDEVTLFRSTLYVTAK